MESYSVNDNQIVIIEGTHKEFDRYYTDDRYYKDEFASMLSNGIFVPFYAVCGEEKVGQIYFVKQLVDHEVADGRTIGYICNLSVLSQYRKRGIGTALVNFVKEYAKKNGFDKLSLGVEEKEVQNLRLYKNLMFVNKIKDTDVDMLFRNENNEPIIVGPYIIISCDI